MEKGSRPKYVTLPIIIVFLAIAYLYYATVFVVVNDWLGLTTVAGLANAAVFSALALMSVVTYVMAICRDPGHVPSSYMHDVEDSESFVHEIKRKGGDLRYCEKCSHYKPPRAHHCRVCKRCVLRMDHHCVWINNCVGDENYKIFFVFVLYAVTACIHSMVLFLSSASSDVHKNKLQSGSSFRTSYFICGILLFPLTVALSVLLGWHIYLILHNKTTIEYHEGLRAKWLAEKLGNGYRHPYDVGTYENLSAALGSNIFCWLCPTMGGHTCSGLRFRTLFDNTHSSVPR